MHSQVFGSFINILFANWNFPNSVADITNIHNNLLPFRFNCLYLHKKFCHRTDEQFFVDRFVMLQIPEQGVGKTTGVKRGDIFDAGLLCR